MVHKKKLILVSISVVLLIGVIVMIPVYNYNQLYARKLIAAIKDKDITKVEKIVKQKGNINAKPYTVLSEFWLRLTENGNFPPIYYACWSENIEIVKLLVENGADINVFCYKDYYPLATALDYFQSSEERLQITEYFLERGLDVKQIESRKKNFWAIIFRGGIGTGNTAENETIEYQIFLDFIAEGISPKEETVFYDGNFLHTTAKWDNVLITKYLVEELNYNINAIGGDGQTPLIKTVINNSKNMLEYLLSKGADKTIKDDSGKTALDYATESGNADFIALLS